MPADITTVPAVLSALVALGATTMPDPVKVFDGSPDTDQPPDEFLSIGFSRAEDEGSVDGDTTDQGNHTCAESYMVHCLLSVATGDTGPGTVAARRTRAAELWGMYAGAIRADPTLGGVLTAGGRASCTGFAWIYGPSLQGGTYAEVAFDVAVTAGYLGMT